MTHDDYITDALARCKRLASPGLYGKQADRRIEVLRSISTGRHHQAPVLAEAMAAASFIDQHGDWLSEDQRDRLAMEGSRRLDAIRAELAASQPAPQHADRDRIKGKWAPPRRHTRPGCTTYRRDANGHYQQV